MSLSLSIDTETWGSDIIDDLNFSYVAEGKTWEEVSVEDAAIADFTLALTDEGVRAFLPAMLVGCLDTDSADVLLYGLPRFLDRLAPRATEVFDAAQIACVCLLLGGLSPLTADPHYDGFHAVWKGKWESICERRLPPR